MRDQRGERGSGGAALCEQTGRVVCTDDAALEIRKPTWCSVAQIAISLLA